MLSCIDRLDVRIPIAPARARQWKPGAFQLPRLCPQANIVQSRSWSVFDHGGASPRQEMDGLSACERSSVERPFQSVC